MTVTIETSGSTSLIANGNNFYFSSNGSSVLLKYTGAAVVAGQFGAWVPIGAEQTSNGYEVAWEIAGSDQYSVWATDSSGNFTSLLIGPVSGGSAALQPYEASFHQDLNGDGVIQSAAAPAQATTIEASGSTSLIESGNNFYFDSSNGSSVQLKYAGAAVAAGQFGGWVPIGAEQIANGYEVAWKISGSDQYSVWATDSNGNFTSLVIGPVSGNSAALKSYETSFQQNLNGDGVTGSNAAPAQTTIEAIGSTSLIQSGNNFYFDGSNGSSVLLKYAGTAVAAGQFGAWVPIGAEQIANGYEVAWKISGSDQYSVWATDSSGNFSSLVIGPVSGNSAALKSYETSFHQDLNGDGVIGSTAAPAQTTIEAIGSTSLIESGNNFYFDGTNGSSVLLKYAGAAVAAGQFGGWVPIGAEQIANGYEVAWKIPGSDQYSIWITDSAGNYSSLAIGPVSGSNAALQPYEASFHQDLNGDGVIGLAGQRDLTGYTLTFDEEFNSRSISQTGAGTTWADIRPEWRFDANSDIGFGSSSFVDPASGYDPFKVQNGVLSITAVPDRTASGYPGSWESGLITTEGHFSQTYGYFEIRADFSSLAGAWDAFWLLPDKQIPDPNKAGQWQELDVVEHYGGWDKGVYSTIHTTDAAPNLNWQANLQVYSELAQPSGYHTYGVDWEKDTISFYVDGQLMGTKPTPSDMHSPMYLLADLATQTSSSNNANAANVPITSYIDYIRAYSAPNSSPSANAAALPSASSIGAGPDQFKLAISEDAFNGDAQYTISVDGVQVGGVQTAHAAHASGQSDLLLVQGSWESGTHDVAVQFLNDANSPGVGDRNLYIDNASYHGLTMASVPHALLSSGAFHFDI